MLRSKKEHEKVLSLDKKGWIQVHPTFQSILASNVFVSGDCASICQYPNIPKAGVYAVRAGPILFHNIISYLFHSNDPMSKSKLQTYTPQSDFLKLINIGDGTALGFRFNMYFYGNWVWLLKDSIDRKFINLFLEEYLIEDKNNNENDDDVAVRQFDDASEDGNETKLDVKDAANMLISNDIDNYHIPWKIIKDMIDDKEYASNVGESVKLLRQDNITI